MSRGQTRSIEVCARRFHRRPRASILELVVSEPPAEFLPHVNILASGAQGSLSRQGVSAGPVVATLAVITLVVILAVLAMAYLMYLRDRR